MSSILQKLCCSQSSHTCSDYSHMARGLSGGQAMLCNGQQLIIIRVTQTVEQGILSVSIDAEKDD